MVDYTQGTGTAGQLIIRDDGSTVTLYVTCTDPATNVGSASWWATINGSKSGSFSFPAGLGTRTIGSWTVTTSQTVSFGIGATGTQGLGGPTSFSAWISRPAPNAPSNLTVTRISDSQQKLDWSRNSTYTSVVVQRRVASGGGWGSWQQVGVASGNAFTFTDKTTVANRRYEYRVAGRAATGQSAWSNTDDVYTTPAVPTGVSAAREGDNIRVSVSGVPPYATSFDVRDGATQVATGVSLPWVHVSPSPLETHTYTVRAKRGSLVSGWSAPSNTVQLITPPNPPMGLTPNGAVVPSDEDVTFGWVHNPVDSSPQSAYELRYREPEGVWTVLAGGTEASVDVSLPVGDVEWQVRTKGEHPDWSGWSATAVFAVVDRPGVAVTSPEDEWDASTLTAEWSWFQPQGRPQSGWQVELVDDLNVVVESRSGSGSAGSLTFTTRLTEGVWTVRVRAATGDVWSVWAEQSFTVTFDPPAPPVVEGVWDDIQGGVFLAVGVGTSGVALLGGDGAWYADFTSGGVPNVAFDDGHPYVEEGADGGMLFDGPSVMVTDEEPPATVNVVLERSIDGEVWERVAETDDVAALIDWESWSYGDIRYRATAFTAEGAATSTEVVVEARSEHLWLSGGVGFSDTARLPFSPVVQVTAGRARALKQYAGRSLPVALTGEALSRVVSVSGMVVQRSDGEVSAEVDDLVRVAQLPDDVFLFRDPDGRRIYGQIGSIDLPRQSAFRDDGGFNAFWGYSFTLTEVRNEPLVVSASG